MITPIVSMSINMFRLLLLTESIPLILSFCGHFGPSRSQGAPIQMALLVAGRRSRSQGAPIHMALPVRKQDFAHGLRCSVRGDGGAVAWL